VENGIALLFISFYVVVENRRLCNKKTIVLKSNTFIRMKVNKFSFEEEEEELEEKLRKKKKRN
jgi:hypothetical protein